MGPGSLLGSKDTEVRLSQQGSSEAWVELARSKLLHVKHHWEVISWEEKLGKTRKGASEGEQGVPIT